LRRQRLPRQGQQQLPLRVKPLTTTVGRVPRRGGWRPLLQRLLLLLQGLLLQLRLWPGGRALTRGLATPATSASATRGTTAAHSRRRRWCASSSSGSITRRRWPATAATQPTPTPAPTAPGYWCKLLLLVTCGRPRAGRPQAATPTAPAATAEPAAPSCW